MSLDHFVAEREPRWVELDGLLTRSRGRTGRDPASIRRLGTLYRAAAADLAVARRRFAGDPIVRRLEHLVLRARQVVYSSERRSLSFRYFVTTGYWRRVRERPLLLLAGFLLIMGPWILAGVWAVREPARASGLVPSGFGSVVERERADFRLSADEKAQVSSEIFTNNIRVAFLAFAAGIAAGLGTALVLVYQGIVLGTVFGLTIDAGNGTPLFEFVAPHGVLEISCIIVAGAAGMRMGWALVAPGRRRRRDALATEARAAGEIAVGTAIVLVFCGIVEGGLSTSGLGLVPGVSVGVGIGAVYWFLVWWRGKPEPVFRASDKDDDAYDAVIPRPARLATTASAPSR